MSKTTLSRVSEREEDPGVTIRKPLKGQVRKEQQRKWTKPYLKRYENYQNSSHGSKRKKMFQEKGDKCHSEVKPNKYCKSTLLILEVG